MKAPATKIIVAAVVIGAAMIALSGVRVATRDHATCAPGFEQRGPRCLAPDRHACPPPLEDTLRGCDAPERRVLVPATTVTIGPADWEAEGRVKPRVVRAGPFEIDAFEVSVGSAHCPGCPLPKQEVYAKVDPVRAAAGVTLDEARAYCKARRGRLPTDDEWIAAAAGDRPRRYPWGDTGAVCRRAAWGLARGPCATGATGPDAVGAHPDGATPLGVHDLAGNVAEWVEPGPAGPAAVRGGAWDTELATELRTWPRREAPPDRRDETIGFRCVYDVAVR